MADRDREGYILLDRNILEWKWWQKHNVLIVFIWLLLKAQFHDSHFGGAKIERGQVATTIGNIGSANKLSVQEVRTSLNSLKSTGEITITRHSRFLVITIVNYDKYQNLTRKPTIKQQSRNNQSTINQQHTNTYNTYNTGERSINCSAEPYPCGATEKPEWMTDEIWDKIKYRTAENMPGIELGFHDTYIEYVEELHKQGKEIS